VYFGGSRGFPHHFFLLNPGVTRLRRFFNPGVLKKNTKLQMAKSKKFLAIARASFVAGDAFGECVCRCLFLSQQEWQKTGEMCVASIVCVRRLKVRPVARAQRDRCCLRSSVENRTDWLRGAFDAWVLVLF
jgi:hypothetical protein